MKAAITLKVKGGYLVFLYEGSVTLTDVENSVVIEDNYRSQENIGKAVVAITGKEVEEIG